MTADWDRTDPGDRAAIRFARRRVAARRSRVAVAGALAMAALSVPIIAAPATGSTGATVGGVLLAIVFACLAAAIWPWTWSAGEERHRWLEAIWFELRSDAAEQVPWERYAAWAEPRGEKIRVELITCAPATKRIGGVPSPYSRRVVKSIDAEDVATAVTCIEQVREDAAQRELAARTQHRENLLETARRQEEAAVATLERATAAEIAAREEAMRRELREQEAAERRAQAEAVARAIRRS